MRGFDRRDDSLFSGELEECIDRLFVIDCFVVDASDIFEVAMLRPDRRIVQATGYRVDFLRFAIFILEHIGFEAMHHTRFPQGHCCGIFSWDIETSA